MPTPLFSRLSFALVLVTALVVAVVFAYSGATMFSPGGLHAGDSSSVVMGGVSSHAELGRDCASCHVGPMGTATMRALCVQCHSDIRDELQDSTSLHGAFAKLGSCTTCHTEHLGPAGDLTRFEGIGPEHARFGFPLDGAHARVDCAQCHVPVGGKSDFASVEKTCVGCHASDDTHKGSYGPDCASCHTTSSWEGATFEHDVFPISHGARREPSTCATCHTDTSNYKIYTCYGCHAHTPANVEREHRGEVRTQDLTNCIRCHQGGREGGEGEGRGHRGDDREGGAL